MHDSLMTLSLPLLNAVIVGRLALQAATTQEQSQSGTAAHHTLTLPADTPMVGKTGCQKLLDC
jgi:hypothetical protein